MKRILKNISLFFKCNIIFWSLIEVKRSRIGSYDIDRDYYKIYIIRHKVTGKVIDYTRFGNELKQYAIYQVNGEYKAFENCLQNINKC